MQHPERPHHAWVATVDHGLEQGSLIEVSEFQKTASMLSIYNNKPLKTQTFAVDKAILQSVCV